MTAISTRIQWLHRKLSTNSYPNAQRIAERFHISHRQAQRDIDNLKKKFGAPIAYDPAKLGFYYTQPFSLPVLITSDNDDSYIPEIATVRDESEYGATEAIIQMQIPYTATVTLPDRLSAVELGSYITAKAGTHSYLCEFHSVERFIGALISLGSDFRVEEPKWLQEKLVESAKLILKNHKEEPEDE